MGSLATTQCFSGQSLLHYEQPLTAWETVLILIEQAVLRAFSFQLSLLVFYFQIFPVQRIPGAGTKRPVLQYQQ